MSTFSLRLMLVIIALLLSLVVALSTALIAYVTARERFAVLTTSAGAFVATMTLSLAVLALLLP